MDTITLSELRVTAKVGVFHWEREGTQPLLLTIDMGIDLRPAAASDRLEDTIDYDAVASLAAALAVERHYDLIETYAETLSKALFAQFPIQKLSLSVAKPGATPPARAILVRIERVRDDYAETSAMPNS